MIFVPKRVDNDEQGCKPTDTDVGRFISAGFYRAQPTSTRVKNTSLPELDSSNAFDGTKSEILGVL